MKNFAIYSEEGYKLGLVSSKNTTSAIACFKRTNPQFSKSQLYARVYVLQNS